MSRHLRATPLLVALFFLAACEECEFDNSDFWRPNDHGDYNCIGDCDTGDCQLEVLVDGNWVQLGKKREDRDVVDEMAGQEIPTDGPRDTPPTWVRCDCY